MARLDDATDASLWTPDELEELLVRSAPPPVTPDGFVQTDGATTTSASSPSSLPSDDAAVKVADGELDAAARRTRRTEIERLSRRRRQAALRGMRDEVRTLEAEFAGIMNDHAVRYRNTKAPTTLLLDGAPTPIEDDGSEDLKLRDQTIRHLREQFIELKLHEGELEKEKKELHRSLRNKQLLALSIQSLGFSSVRTWTDPEHSLPPASEPAFMLPLADEYTRLMRGAYDELVALEATTAFESLGSSCMGWSGRRAVNDTSLVFSLSKTFAGRDAAPILLESWDVFSSEARLRESFGAWGVHVQLRVLDRPHDDILVIHRSNIRRGCKKSGERRHHVVFLLFRVRTPDGFTLCMRSMPSLQTDLPPPEHWTGIFTWIHLRESLQPDGTNDCEVVYNNYMPYRRRRPVSDAFVAFLSTVVRWESACVASLLLTVA